MPSIPHQIDRVSNIDWNTLWERAVAIATQAHEGQKRWGGEPYITHPLAVAKAFQLAGSDAPVKIAAVLHDVIEDTSMDEKQLRAEFPENPAWQLVIDIVATMTHPEDESYADYIMRVRGAPLACKVKAADIRHNLSDLGNDRKHRQRRDKYELALKLLELS